MPEEINRVLTDQVSDLLFTPSTDGNENLKREGVSEARIHFVGYVMIDTLIHCLPLCQGLAQTGIPESYVLVTLHRPSNVDDPDMLVSIVGNARRDRPADPGGLPHAPPCAQEPRNSAVVAWNLFPRSRRPPRIHSSIKITVDRYGHLIPGANKAAVDRLDDATGRNLYATSGAARMRDQQAEEA